jgi:hypothetical protein
MGRHSRRARAAGAFVAALVVLAAGSAAARRIPVVPMLISFDACVLPSDACTDRYDVVDLIVRGENRRAALTNLKVINGNQTSGHVLSDLTFRPQRVLGPKELLALFEPGARLLVRASIRRGVTELFVQSAEPVAKAAPPNG